MAWAYRLDAQHLGTNAAVFAKELLRDSAIAKVN